MTSQLWGVLARGGTSKGVFFNDEEFPFPARSPERDALLRRVFGVPDPTGMQLDGLGGGISSTSKCVFLRRRANTVTTSLSSSAAVSMRNERYDIEPSRENDDVSSKAAIQHGVGDARSLRMDDEDKGCELDYDFGGFWKLSVAPSPWKLTQIDHDLHVTGQVDMKSGDIDWSGSCGNLGSAVLDVGKAMGLIGCQTRKVRVWQVNVEEEMIVEEGAERVSIPGVPGTSPAIHLSFLGNPNRPLLPTGNPVDRLLDGTFCTLIAGSNPTIFLPQSYHDAHIMPSTSDVDFFTWIDQIRVQGARMMGIHVSDALRVAFVQMPHDYKTSQGLPIKRTDCDVFSRITTPSRRFHHAHTGTGAVNVAIASRIPGTIISDCVSPSNRASNTVRVAHLGGVMPIDVSVERSANERWTSKVTLLRTARVLMKGAIFG